MGNVVSIHQPNFFPWLGYFYKIYKSDIFVILDIVQYTKNSFINRNKIKTPNGPIWLTVPISYKYGQLIKDTQISNSFDWRSKHLKSLELNYKKSRYFEEIFQEIKTLYFKKEWISLSELNITLLKWTLEYLEINTEIIIASNLDGISGKSTELLVNIIKKVGGTVYISGLGAKKYQDEEEFKRHGIKLVYSDFIHPVYTQLWGEFIPNLSILDFMFNCGNRFIETINKGECRSE